MNLHNAILYAITHTQVPKVGSPALYGAIASFSTRVLSKKVIAVSSTLRETYFSGQKMAFCTTNSVCVLLMAYGNTSTGVDVGHDLLFRRQQLPLLLSFTE
jgi:hypothetical protein